MFFWKITRFLDEKNRAKMGFLNFVFSNFSLITKYKTSYLPYFKFIVKDYVCKI